MLSPQYYNIVIDYVTSWNRTRIAAATMRSNCHYTKATRHDNTKKNSYHNNIIKKNLVLVSSYKNCFNINSNFIRIKYKYHYFNRNVRVISTRNIKITTISFIRSISTFTFTKGLGFRV